MTDYDPTTWASALLTRLGEPATDANVSAITAWESAEGGNWNNTAHYNPLNTTYVEPGSSTMNGSGVRSYSSWDQGLAATVATLQEAPYTGILDALLPGDDATGVVQAVTSSPWGTKSITLGSTPTTATDASSTSSALGSLLTGSGGQGLIVQGLCVAAAVALAVAGIARATGTHPLRAAGRAGALL